MVLSVKKFFWSEARVKRYKNFLANFQELISHWLLTFKSKEPSYHRGLGLSFPKWYDTCYSDENLAVYSQITEELHFCQNFGQNFRGLFRALNLKIFLKKKYFWVPLDRYYLFLRSKTNFKKLPVNLNLFVPTLSQA